MKIILIGATGYTGSRICHEALTRGHDITAIVRDVSRIKAHPRLTPVEMDVRKGAQALVRVVNGHDVLISAFNPGKDPSGQGIETIMEAARRCKPMRLLVVGGAGSLEIEPGKRIVDQPDFPEQWKAGALIMAAFLDALRRQSGALNWTFISPAANLVQGTRTGSYRVGGDRLLTDSHGESLISVEDYAVAMIDEMETMAHPNTRISVAY